MGQKVLFIFVPIITFNTTKIQIFLDIFEFPWIVYVFILHWKPNKYEKLIHTLKISACCFLTWLSFAPLELKNNGQLEHGNEFSGIIPCAVLMWRFNQKVLHKLWPHMSHLQRLCMLYLCAFNACGVPKDRLHSSHCSGVWFSCLTLMCSSKLLPLVKVLLHSWHWSRRAY